jgi:hypothetical protein
LAKKRTKRKVDWQTLPELAAGYCVYHNKHMSFKQIRFKGCLDKKKQFKHGNIDGICPHMQEQKFHPVWELLKASGR